MNKFSVETSVPNFFYSNCENSLKLVIEPNKYYFESNLDNDRKNFDRIVLITGLEPKEINDISDLIINNFKKIDEIYCSCPKILSECPNSVLFPFGSCWVLTDNFGNRVDLLADYYNIFTTDKKFEVSFVMSNKNYLPGHKLRHIVKEVINEKRKYNLIFPETISIEKKNTLFKNSMFHICIENTKNPNYFTEKIIDCFMSYTIPIYWGCPNIGEFFDENGIITFNTYEELKNILDNINPSDYNKRLESIIKNYDIAYNKYAFFYDRINNLINKN